MSTASIGLKTIRVSQRLFLHFWLTIIWGFVLYVGVSSLVFKSTTLVGRDYNAALEGIRLARRFYTEAGPQGVEGLSRARDPGDLVRAAATRDGRCLKAEAVHAIRQDPDRAKFDLILSYFRSTASPIRHIRRSNSNGRNPYVISCTVVSRAKFLCTVRLYTDYGHSLRIHICT